MVSRDTFNRLWKQTSFRVIGLTTNFYYKRGLCQKKGLNLAFIRCKKEKKCRQMSRTKADSEATRTSPIWIPFNHFNRQSSGLLHSFVAALRNDELWKAESKSEKRTEPRFSSKSSLVTIFYTLSMFWKQPTFQQKENNCQLYNDVLTKFVFFTIFYKSPPLYIVKTTVSRKLSNSKQQ